MNPASPEQPEPPESTIQEEILVPKNIIRPLARGLSQLAAEPLRNIKTVLSKVNTVKTDLEREQVEGIRQGLSEIANDLTLLKTAKEVKIIRPTPDQYKLVFSAKTEEEETPLEEDMQIDETLARPLMFAIFDRLGYNLARVLGYSGLLELRGSSDKLKRQGRKIFKQAQKLNKRWKPIQATDYKLEISPDDEGNITIKPIPKPPPLAS